MLKLIGLLGLVIACGLSGIMKTGDLKKKSSAAGGLPANDHRAERTDKLFQGSLCPIYSIN